MGAIIKIVSSFVFVYGGCILTSVHDLPVVEHGLREGLASGLRAQFGVETERLRNGQICLDGEHGRADTLLLAEDLATTLVEHGVDTADRVFGALDLDYRAKLAGSEIITMA